MRFLFAILMFMRAVALVANGSSPKAIAFKSVKSDFTEFSSVSALRSYAKIPSSNMAISDSKARKILLRGVPEALRSYYNPAIVPNDDFIEKFAMLFPASKTGLKEDLILLSYSCNGSEVLIAMSLFNYVIFIRSPEKVFGNFPKDISNLENINKVVNIIFNRKDCPYSQYHYYESQLDRISINEGIIESTYDTKYKFLPMKFFATKDSVALLIRLPLPMRAVLSNQYFADRIKRSQEPPPAPPKPPKPRPLPEIELLKVMMFPPFEKDIEKRPIAFIRTKKGGQKIYNVGDAINGYKVLAITLIKGGNHKWEVKVEKVETGKIIVLKK